MDKSKTRIHLYTTFYNEKNSVRKNELLKCIHRNIENRFIDSITIVNENKNPNELIDPKIVNIFVQERPTYSHFFQRINQHLPNNDIHIIANTDIYFDENIAVLKHLNLENTCFALSRWDILENGKAKLFNRNDSQDAWIFRAKIKHGLNANFPLGVPRCDNKLMFELEQAGYNVLNPAFSIKAFHMHKGREERIYTEDDNRYNIKPPYRYKYPHNLWGLFRTTAFNLTHKEQVGQYTYDIKKINNWFFIKAFRYLYEVFSHKKMRLTGYK